MGETSPKGPEKEAFPVPRKLATNNFLVQSDPVKTERPALPMKKVSTPDFLKRDEPFPVESQSRPITSPLSASPVKPSTPPKSIVKVRQATAIHTPPHTHRHTHGARAPLFLDHDVDRGCV